MSTRATSSEKEATDWLREHRLRATHSRVAIIRLLTSGKIPLTLAEIHDKVRANGCDFATVFRFISILEDKKLVERVAWIDGTTRHEMRDEHHHHHHYLICRSCHKVEPLDECVVERFEHQIARERGYTGLNHSLQLSGVCPQCQDGKPKKSARKRSPATSTSCAD